MKCQDIDYIAYLEGRASSEEENHLADCPACREELARFSLSMNRILPVYREGKRRDEEIERGLAEINLERLEPLPPVIAEKVKALREKRLISRLKRAVGENTENARIWIDSMMNPQMGPLPAIPKDILKTGVEKPERKPKKGKKITPAGWRHGKNGAGNATN
jgi:hypothetical protein